jgi:hypothetical protein
MTEVVCVACGERVQAEAAGCPACGADPQTGALRFVQPPPTAQVTPLLDIGLLPGILALAGTITIALLYLSYFGDMSVQVGLRGTVFVLPACVIGLITAMLMSNYSGLAIYLAAVAGALCLCAFAVTGGWRDPLSLLAVIAPAALFYASVFVAVGRRRRL